MIRVIARLCALHMPDCRGALTTNPWLRIATTLEPRRLTRCIALGPLQVYSVLQPEVGPDSARQVPESPLAPDRLVYHGRPPPP